MAKIITVTANTALDLFLEVEGLTSQDNILAKSSAEYACGKGVNVARAITAHGMPITCLGFVGRQSMPAFRALESRLLQVDFTPVEGKTRTNITLFDSKTKRETHIRTAGYSVTDQDCQRLGLKLEESLETGDIVVLSGSLPAGASDDFYANLLDVCHRAGALTTLDSSGNSLKSGIQGKPYIIKPNQQELEELVGESLSSIDAIINAARRLLKQGIGWVYVSRGEQGVIAVGAETAIAANIPAVPDGIVTHVGCGDAMVAGLVLATLNQSSPEQTLRTAVASGVANLYCSEPGQYDKGMQAELQAMVEMRSL